MSDKGDGQNAVKEAAAGMAGLPAGFLVALGGHPLGMVNPLLALGAGLGFVD
jgi:hypothetical protein